MRRDTTYSEVFEPYSGWGSGAAANAWATNFFPLLPMMLATPTSRSGSV